MLVYSFIGLLIQPCAIPGDFKLSMTYNHHLVQGSDRMGVGRSKLGSGGGVVLTVLLISLLGPVR